MTKKEHGSREHLECGGSSAHRWGRCSASVYLARLVGKLPDTKASLYGTDTHELADVCLNDFLEHKLIGTDPEANYRREKALRDEQQIDAVEFYRDYIWNEVLGNSITNKAWGIEDLVVHADCDKMGGPADFWAAHINDKGERVLHIVDFKNGTDPVDINHEQFICYGICLRSMIRKQGKDIDKLITHLVQPNSMDGKLTQSKSYTPKQMDAKEEWFLKAIHKIYVEKGCQYKVGWWCKYCAGMTRCEKHGKKVAQETGLALLDDNILVPEVPSLTEAQVVAIALNEAKLKELCKACKAAVIGAHMEGRSFAGCKVVQTNPRRAMPKDVTPLISALEKEGVSQEEMFNRKIKGIGELEKLLGPKKKLLDKYVVYGNPIASVVPEDDPRPEATDLTNLLVD